MSATGIPTAPTGAPTTAAAAGAADGRRATARRWLPRVVYGGGVLAVVIIACTTSGFFDGANYQAILQSLAITGLLAVGVTPIMLSGNFFALSLGATLVASSMVFLAALSLGLVIAIVLALALGVLVGLIQGGVIGLIRTEPIITSIAFSTIITGVALWLSHGNAVTPGGSSTAYRALADTKLADIPLPTILFLVAVALLALLLRWTRWGREVYLLGSSGSAARTAGLNTTRIVIGTFLVAGVVAAAAGIVVGAQTSQATLGFGSSYDFNAVTAVLVGGTAITGGRGSVLGAIVGTVFIALVSDLLLLHGANLQTQLFVEGLIVLIVVSLTGWVRLVAADR